VLGCFLQLRVDREVEVLPGFRRDATERLADLAMIGVDLDLLVARLAVKAILVEALDAGLADVRRAGVVALVESREIVLVDAPDRADTPASGTTRRRRRENASG
jgi:hypothetical protein